MRNLSTIVKSREDRRTKKHLNAYLIQSIFEHVISWATKCNRSFETGFRNSHIMEKKITFNILEKKVKFQDLVYLTRYFLKDVAQISVKWFLFSQVMSRVAFSTEFSIWVRMRIYESTLIIQWSYSIVCALMLTVFNRRCTFFVVISPYSTEKIWLQK